MHRVKSLKLPRPSKRWFAAAIILMILVGTVVVSIRIYSAVQANAHIYTLDKVPGRPVAVVFGAEIYWNGNLSPMLQDRVRTAIKLYQQGTIKALLMTGDNSLKTYNEPEAMRNYAIKMGVPTDAIVLDYAGFSTYDSCYRARDIFKVDKAILVTQAFHLDRALLICNSLGVDSVGVAADVVRPEGYAKRNLLSSQLREFPSTMLAVINLLRGTKPAFLGDPLPIFSNAP